jgi:hypothetical protein
MNACVVMQMHHHHAASASAVAPASTLPCSVTTTPSVKLQADRQLKGRSRKTTDGSGCDSLDRTCKKLLLYLMGEREKKCLSDGAELDFKLSQATAVLGEPSHRRLYDILHVLHAVGIIKRHRHNKYVFLGVSCIPDCVTAVAERPAARDLNESAASKENQPPKLFEVSQRLLQSLHKLGPNKIVTVADMLTFVSGGMPSCPSSLTLAEKASCERSRSCVSRRLYDAVSVLKGCGVVKVCRVAHPAGSKTRHPNTKSFMMTPSIFDAGAGAGASTIALDLDDSVETVFTDLEGCIREENRPNFQKLRRDLETPAAVAVVSRKRPRLTAPEIYMPYKFLSNNGYDSPCTAGSSKTPVMVKSNQDGISDDTSPVLVKPNRDEYDVASFLSGLGSMPAPKRLTFDSMPIPQPKKMWIEPDVTSPTSVVYFVDQPVCSTPIPIRHPQEEGGGGHVSFENCTSKRTRHMMHCAPSSS